MDLLLQEEQGACLLEDLLIPLEEHRMGQPPKELVVEVLLLLGLEQEQLEEHRMDLLPKEQQAQELLMVQVHPMHMD